MIFNVSTYLSYFEFKIFIYQGQNVGIFYGKYNLYSIFYKVHIYSNFYSNWVLHDNKQIFTDTNQDNVR